MRRLLLTTAMLLPLPVFAQDVALILGNERYGHFVTDGTRTWLLTAEATEPDLFTVDTVGVSLDSVLRILSARQGKAVLVLGVAQDDGLDMTDSALRAGLGTFNLPNGVTVIETTPTLAASVLAGPLTDPEAVIGETLAANPRLDIQGFLPPDWVLMPGEVIVDAADEDTGPSVAKRPLRKRG